MTTKKEIKKSEKKVTKPRKLTIRKGEKKPVVKMTPEVKDFILEKMYSGMNIAEIARKYPNDVPSASAIYATSYRDQEFARHVNDAYAIMVKRELDAFNDLLDINWCRDRMDNFAGDYKLAFEARRTLLDGKKFFLAKMAPMLSSRFQKHDHLEVSGIDARTQIAVINYYADQQKPKDTLVNIVNKTEEKTQEN